jgi:hypothetical protein
MVRRLVVIYLALSLMGCSSLQFRNIAKTGTTTSVAYLVAGPIPAIANLATSMAYDELIPEQPSVEQIESKEQAVAYVAESLFMNLLYGGIAYLLITLIAVPFIKRWGYNQAKVKYGRRKDD